MTTGAVQPAFQPPAPINWAELIAAGRATLIPHPPAAQPAPGAIRRAISTAYYAVFHALTASNADSLIGPSHDQLTAEAWIRIYRGLEMWPETPILPKPSFFNVDYRCYSG